MYVRHNVWRHSFISNLYHEERVLYGLPPWFGCAASLNQLSFPSYRHNLHPDTEARLCSKLPISKAGMIALR
jgi:hypothetical protein